MPTLVAFMFAAPTLLLGAAAAALPILIHFLLRPKARRMRFPPVTFLAASLASGQRAQRARDVWLLTLRALLIGLVAALLAGPTCSRPRSASMIDAPLAAALVLDDSWSVRYSIDAESTVLDRCISEADSVAAGASSWPQPSVLALFRAEPDADPLEPTGDFGVIRDALAKTRMAPPHATPLGRCLREAARMLSSARQPLHRLVIFTDLAAHAWRDVPVGLLASINDLTVQVVSPFAERRSNIAVTSAAAPPAVHPENAPVPIAVTVAAAGIDSSATLLAFRGGEEVARAGPLSLAAGAASDCTLSVAPTSRGTHGIEIRAEPMDRLPFDQIRYVVWQTGERPRAWLVAGADPLDVELAATLYRNLLAPESLEPTKQPFNFVWLDPSAIVSPTAEASRTLARPDLIVILPVGELTDAARQVLLKHVEDGAVLLLACGSRERSTDWPGLRRVFSPMAPTLQSLDAPSTIAWERTSDFAGKTDGAEEVTRAAVRRRIAPDELADGVVIQARYADGGPAILSKRHGRGEIFLLTTSPDPRWSDLGIRASGLLSWLHALVARTQDSAEAVRSTTIGDPLRPPMTWPPAAGTPSVQSEIAGGPLLAPLKPSDGRLESFPARLPGIYSIRSADGATTRIAANWPAEESELRPITIERLKEILGTDHVQLGEDAGGAPSPTVGRWFGGAADPLTWWPLLLIGVVALEMWLASRAK